MACVCAGRSSIQKRSLAADHVLDDSEALCEFGAEAFGMRADPVGEFAAPSDGVAFVASTTYTEGLSRRGARIATVKRLPYHHVGVTVWPDVLAYIEGFFGGRNPR